MSNVVVFGLCYQIKSYSRLLAKATHE